MKSKRLESIMASDEIALGKIAAELVFVELKKCYDIGNLFVLGCPGGRTPRSTYSALANLIQKNNQSLSHVVIAMMDDYAVQSNDASFKNVDDKSHFSCKKFAYDEIRDVLNGDLPNKNQILMSNVLIPDARDPKSFEDTLMKLGVDIFLLASGASDGHVAFNGVGSGRNERTRITPLSVETRKDNLKTFPDFASLDEVPNYGVTVGPATIVDVSKQAIMLLTGSEKNQAYKRISTATKYESDWPATIIAECSNALIIADKFAATSN